MDQRLTYPIKLSHNFLRAPLTPIIMQGVVVKKRQKMVFFQFCSSKGQVIALFWYHFKSVVNVHHHCLWGQGGGHRGGQNSTKVLQHRCSTPKNNFFAVFAYIINISTKNYQNIKKFMTVGKNFSKAAIWDHSQLSSLICLVVMIIWTQTW